MTYKEFTALAKRSITETRYHEIVEPVYNYHPACIDKPTTATLFDIGGLQLFLDMRCTAERIKELESKRSTLKRQLDEVQNELDTLFDDAYKQER